MRDTPRVNSTPTGTITLTAELSAGMAMNKISISTSGAMAIFQFRETNTTPNPPKSAGRIYSKAGARTGDSRTGVRGTISRTPRIIMKVVTMLETAMATVATTSPSSVFTSAFT